MNTNRNRLTLLKRSALVLLAALLLVGTTAAMSSCSLVLAAAGVFFSKTDQMPQWDDSVSRELAGVIPEDVKAATVTDSAVLDHLPPTVTKAYICSNDWCVVEITTRGYADGLVLLCAVDGDGTVKSLNCVSHNETENYGAKLLEDGTVCNLFTGVNADTLYDVDVYSGATKTLKGVRSAVSDALAAAEVILEGGSN